MSIRKSKFKLKFELVQQTPLIHFQCDEPGACLRASEVKPKLDRFIHDWIEKQNEKITEDEKKRRIPDEWYVDKKDKKEKPALDYKMHIFPIGDATRSDVKSTEIKKLTTGNRKLRPSKPIDMNYFGNLLSFKHDMSQIEKKRMIVNMIKDTVFYGEGLRIEIICFHEDLLREIKGKIDAFFLLHNFGSRQNKGFGSFATKNLLNWDYKDICRRLFMFCNWAFFIDYIENNIGHTYDLVLKDVNIISNLMKSGINYTSRYRNGVREVTNTPNDYFKGFIFRNFTNEPKNVINDKVFMKRILDNENSDGEDRKYVRAMLGLHGSIEFHDEERNGVINVFNRQDIEVTDGKKVKKERIGRFNNPVLFKPVGRYLFIIPTNIPQIMLNRDFYFTTEKEKGYQFWSNEKISTPDNFDLEKFLQAFTRDFNDKSSLKGGDIPLNDAKDYKLKRVKTLVIKPVKKAGAN